VNCLGFYQGFDRQNNLQTPALHLFPQYLHSAHWLQLTSLSWVLYKITLSFRQEFGTKVFTGGWTFVTLWWQTLVRRLKICNECQYAAHMHFLGQAFPTKKSNLVCFFHLKKAQCVEKHPEFQNLQKSSAKTAKFQNLQKSKILNPALGVHDCGCSVLPSVTS